MTPAPSSTEFRYLWSPVGTLSIFAYLTPVPYPFGSERTGYLVTDMDAALGTVPENRIYLSPGRVDAFVHAFLHFSRGNVTADDWHADAGELGRPGLTYRRVRIESKFGKMQVMATDGQLPYPFGYDINGYEVGDLDETLSKAKSQRVKILFAPYATTDRRTALVQFPGGYIAEIHSPAR